MVIQKLTPDPSGLSRLLGGIGQGLGSGVQQGIESQVLQDILSKQDFTKDPQGFISALVGAPVSRQAKQDVFGGVGSLQSLQLGEQNMELKRRNQELLEKKVDIDDTERYENTIRRVAQDLSVPADKIDWMLGAIGDAKTYEQMVPLIKKDLKKTENLYGTYANLIEKSKKEGRKISKANQTQLANIAKKLKPFDEGRIYQTLEDQGITDINDQLKYTSKISDPVKKVLKSMPHKTLAGQIPFGKGVTTEEKKKIITRNLAPHMGPDFPVGLVVKELQKIGYDQEDIQDIFAPYLEELSARQQEELIGASQRSLGEMFKGLIGVE